MKRVLLLGDSIREYCQTEVQKILGREYAVYFPWENGRFSGYTLNSLRYWLEKIPVEYLDTIHWNNGLWDTAILYGENKCFCGLEEYLDNMERILTTLRNSTNAKIILATTTPTRKEKENMEKSRHCLSDIQRYNEALVKKLSGRVDAINDLYSLVLPEREKMISNDFIHPNTYGTQRISQQICDAIRAFEIL